MEQTPSKHDSKKKKSNTFLRVFPWVGTVLLILAIAVGIYFYVTKKPLTLAPNGTSVTVIVCDDSIVSTYNAASELKARGSGTDPSVDVAGLNALDSVIRAKSGYDQDPTCQTILFWNAIMNNDSGKAKLALTSIESLHDSHHFTDNNLEGNASISVMKSSLAAITGKS